MKYKEIFKSWWFYTLFIVYAIFSVFTNLQTYGSLYLAEYLGIILGSFIGTLFFVSIIFGLFKFFGLFVKKKK